MTKPFTGSRTPSITRCLKTISKWLSSRRLSVPTTLQRRSPLALASAVLVVLFSLFVLPPSLGVTWGAERPANGTSASPQCQTLAGIREPLSWSWEDPTSQTFLGGDTLRVHLKSTGERLPQGQANPIATQPAEKITVCASLQHLGKMNSQTLPLPLNVVQQGKDDVLLKVSLVGNLPLGVRRPAQLTLTATGQGMATVSSSREILISLRGLCLFLSSALVAGIYLFLSQAVHLYYAHPAGTSDEQSPYKHHCWRILDPVVVTAGSYGSGSLSNFQLLWFTLIVAWLLSNAWLTTGNLPDLSSDLLWILGIAGGTKVAAIGVVNVKSRLSLDNWNWLVTSKFLRRDTDIDPANTALWRDLVLDNGVLDPSRYQLMVFSLVVGVNLLFGSSSDVQSFQVPEFFRSLQGVSSAIFLFGKAVAPNTVDEFEKWLSANKSRLEQTPKPLNNDDSGYLSSAITSLFGPAALGSAL